MSKGIIYYFDNILEGTIPVTVRKYISRAELPITSASLRPLDFGDNEAILGKRSYPTMVRQIISCLERAESEYVFFCEADVLYHKSHFDFTPPTDNLFYYNENSWRWLYGDEKAIRHDRMLSLSGLCANRELALEHYKKRQEMIKKKGWSEFVTGEPHWVRRMGYEPGTKSKRRGGYFDCDYDTWKSEYPNIDIRHGKTFSSSKTKISDFKHPPKWWEEIEVEDIEGWNLEDIL